MRRTLLGLAALIVASLLPGTAGHAVTPTNPTATTAKSAATSTSTQSILNVATYNVCRAAACPAGQYAWHRRINAIVANIDAADADVVAVQEADVWDGSLAELAGRLAAAGYVLADRGALSCQGKCESHLFVKPDRFSVMTAGSVSFAKVARGAPWGGPVDDRHFAYALLRDNLTGGRVLALSIHLPNQMATASATVQRNLDVARNASARALARWTAQRAGEWGIPDLPTIVMGDFNSYLRKHPRGPQFVLQRRGFVDADTAAERVNPTFGTINKIPMDAKWRGFPPRPRRFLLGGPQIDCIMARDAGQMLRWEVFVQRLPDGRFDNAYRGSDHNLVRAGIAVPVR